MQKNWDNSKCLKMDLLHKVKAVGERFRCGVRGDAHIGHHGCMMDWGVHKLLPVM